MGWKRDNAKVKSQWDEFKIFLDHARGDEPAGLEDIFGRLNQATPADVPIQRQPQVENNYYLIQLAQLYEAGLISQQTLQSATTNIYG
jgi:hypothetical protein